MSGLSICGEGSGEDSSVKDSGMDSVVYCPFSVTVLCSLYFWRGFWGGFFCKAFWGGFCGEDSGVDSVVDGVFSLQCNVFLFSLFLERILGRILL